MKLILVLVLRKFTVHYGGANTILKTIQRTYIIPAVVSVAEEKHVILWGMVKGNWLGQSDQGRLIWEEYHWTNVWRKVRSYFDQRMQFRSKELHVQRPWGEKQYSVLEGMKKGQCGNRYRRSGHGENRGG